jgi:RimJ/RimL family protein N-acetyltransferase
VKHTIQIKGYAFQLRPIEYADAQFIVEVRTPDRSAFMQPIERSVEAQRAFLEAYFQKADDYYFVVERADSQHREGLTGLLNFDQQHKSAEWGRHILLPNSAAAAESALLVFRLAFERFGLDELRGTVLTGNKRMISYLDSCGFTRRGVVHFPVGGVMRDSFEYVLSRARWREVESSLDDLARMAAGLFKSTRRHHNARA